MIKPVTITLFTLTTLGQSPDLGPSTIPYMYRISGAVWDCDWPGPDIATTCAFVANSVFEIVDVSDPGNPRIVGATPAGLYPSLGFEATDLAISGLYAYVAGAAVQCESLNFCYYTGSALQVIGLGKPHAPYVVATWSSASPAPPEFISSAEMPHTSLTMSGALAFLAGYSIVRSSDGLHRRHEALHIIDISNPAVPKAVYSGDRPSISAQFESDRVFLRVAGPRGFTGRVQRSGALEKWFDWMPVTFGDTAFELVDVAAGQARAFYRVSMP
jgi:hypothetical protein